MSEETVESEFNIEIPIAIIEGEVSVVNLPKKFKQMDLMAEVGLEIPKLGEQVTKKIHLDKGFCFIVSPGTYYISCILEFARMESDTFTIEQGETKLVNFQFTL